MGWPRLNSHHRRRATSTVIAAAMLLLPVTAGAGAVTGTSAQVAAAVAASAKVTTVSAIVLGELTSPMSLRTSAGYPVVKKDCLTVTACVFGDLNASRTMVLYGDSHAMMWLPAVVPYATHNHLRLVLLWLGACPIIALPGAYTVIGYNGSAGPTSESACAIFRTSAMQAISSLHPNLVMVAERTANVVMGASATGRNLFPSSIWSRNLSVTLASLHAASPRVVLVEDIPYVGRSPGNCLSRHLKSVQGCVVPCPNTNLNAAGASLLGQQSAERAAARTTSTGLIPTTQWFCTTAGPGVEPIINDIVTYYDESHVSAPYAAWLSGVMGGSITRVLLPRSENRS